MWTTFVISLGVVDAADIVKNTRKGGHDRRRNTRDIEKDKEARIPFQRILMSALDAIERGGVLVLVHGGVLDVVLLARRGEFEGLPHEDEPVHDGSEYDETVERGKSERCHDQQGTWLARVSRRFDLGVWK